MFFTDKDLKKLIIPLVIEQILIMTVGMADTMMIASVGEAAVSGVSLVDTLNILIINILAALATGGAVVAGQFLGQKEEDKARKSAWQLVLFTTTLSIIVMVAFIAAHDFLLRNIFGSIDADVYANAKSYLLITALSIVPLAIYNCCGALFRAMGNSKVTMWISLIMNAVNIIGNAILIFGVGIGTAGAAISTTVSRYLAAIIAFTLLYGSAKSMAKSKRKNTNVREIVGEGEELEGRGQEGKGQERRVQEGKGQDRKIQDSKVQKRRVREGRRQKGRASDDTVFEKSLYFKGYITWKPDFHLIGRILYIGVPNGLESSMFQLGKILLLSLVSTFGTYAIAANAVCNTIGMFNILPGVAIGYAQLSVVSYCIGAKDENQAKCYTKKLMLLTNLFIALLSVVVLLSAPYVIKLYQLSPQTAQLAKEIMCYHAIMAIFFWVCSFGYPNSFRAAGDVMYPMVVSIISMWVFRIGAAYILSKYFNLGLMGVWIAMTIDWIFRGIMFVYRYLSGKWLTNSRKNF